MKFAISLERGRKKRPVSSRPVRFGFHTAEKLTRRLPGACPVQPSGSSPQRCRAGCAIQPFGTPRFPQPFANLCIPLQPPVISCNPVQNSANPRLQGRRGACNPLQPQVCKTDVGRRTPELQTPRASVCNLRLPGSRNPLQPRGCKTDLGRATPQLQTPRASVCNFLVARDFLSGLDVCNRSQPNPAHRHMFSISNDKILEWVKH